MAPGLFLGRVDGVMAVLRPRRVFLRRRPVAGAGGIGYGLVTIGNGVALTQADEPTALFARIRK
jgi:hypothetical protein